MKDIKAQLMKMDNTIEKIDTRLDKIEITQTEHTLDLKYHISRTDKLQEMVEPIYKLKLQVLGIVKFLSVIVASAAVIKLAITVFKKF